MNVDMDTGGTGSRDVSSASTANPISRATDMIIGLNESSKINISSNSKSDSAMRKAMWRMRNPRRGTGRKQGSSQSGRFSSRRQRRIWQLPKSSIDEYTKWIQEKPEADRTPNEERFLWKCMIRSLGVVTVGSSSCHNHGGPTEKNGKRSRQERIREFVNRLEAKMPMELSDNEAQFVHLYHKRRKERKAQKQQRKQQQQQQEDGDQAVSWMRGDGNSSNSGNYENAHIHHKSNRKSKGKNNKKNKGFEPQASLESLRESMNRMGLSSDKLKQVRFADQSIG